MGGKISSCAYTVVIPEERSACGGPDLVEPEGDEVQHGGELAEHDGLAAGVSLQHALQLLPDRLDLGAAAEAGQPHPVDDAVLPAARHPGRRRLQITNVNCHTCLTFFGLVVAPPWDTQLDLVDSEDRRCVVQTPALDC